MSENKIGIAPEQEKGEGKDVLNAVSETVDRNIREAAVVEQKAQELARQKLNGVLPEDFIKGAQKQTLIGAGIGVASNVIDMVAYNKFGYVGYGLSKVVTDNIGSLLYQTQKPEGQNLQDLTTVDWVAGQFIGNPVVVGGVRNWYNGAQELKKARQAAMGSHDVLVGMASAK